MSVVTIEIPDTIAQSQNGDLERKVLESFAIEGYRNEELSIGQVAELLHISVIEADAFVKERAVPLLYTLEDLEQDRATRLAHRHSPCMVNAAQ